MILFLDIDGVLHPQYDGESTPADVVFCHLPRFEAILRDYPDVDIVISSSWRYQFPLAQLKSHFSSDIAARIVDSTPQIAEFDEYLPARREQEILAWLATAGREGVARVALDDATWQFQRYRDRVVACVSYIGLDDAAEIRLRAVLNI